MNEGPELSETEREALHQVELGIEWLHRAHGALVEFHHNTGHAMDHFAQAEELFRSTEHRSLADELRTDHLPRGVVDSHRWSYDLLEDFDEGFLCEMVRFEERARQSIAGGMRHVAERRQERDWKERAGSEDRAEREHSDREDDYPSTDQ